MPAWTIYAFTPGHVSELETLYRAGKMSMKDLNDEVEYDQSVIDFNARSGAYRADLVKHYYSLRIDLDGVLNSLDYAIDLQELAYILQCLACRHNASQGCEHKRDFDICATSAVLEDVRRTGKHDGHPEQFGGSMWKTTIHQLD